MNRRWWTVGGLAVAVTVVLELLLPAEGHATFWWHKLPGFDLLYGFLGGIGLIVTAKWLGHAWLQRPEHYYEDEEL